MRESPSIGASSSPHALARFGRYEARALGEDYRAESDGFVLAGIHAPVEVDGFTFGTLYGWVAGMVAASATGGSFGSFDASWNYVRTSGSASFQMPVPAGAAWRVELVTPARSEGAPQAWVAWLPCRPPEGSPEMELGLPLSEPPAARCDSKPWQDFEPAMWDLANLVERLVGRPLSQQDKLDFVDVMKRLI